MGTDKFFGSLIVTTKDLLSFTGITTIPYRAFARCANLIEMYAPPQITSCGTYIVGWASKCKTAIFMPTTPPIISGQTFSNASVSQIYVPDDSVEDYKTASNWSGQASKIKPLSEYGS